MSASVQPDLPALAAAMLAHGNIGAAEVAALRAHIFPDGIVSKAEADALCALNAGTPGSHPSWHTLFVEALTDYFVWQTRPRGYIDEAGAEALLAAIRRDGHVERRNELDLMVNVCHWALGCPDRLRHAALEEVRCRVLGGGEALFGVARRCADGVDQADVALVGKLIFTPGGAGSLWVTRGEADLLFDIHDATAEAEIDPGWRDMFVRGVASHLMFPQGEPKLPGLDEAERRERWLAQRHGIGGLIGGSTREAAGGSFAESWRDADPSGKRRRMEERAKAVAASIEAWRRGAIDAEEAAWLLDRIGRNGRLHDNEIELLHMIVATATRMHASLHSLLVKAGVAWAPFWTANEPVSGGERPAA